jgi:uncharacterized tellurite resistance protein B-like protein
LFGQNESPSSLDDTARSGLLAVTLFLLPLALLLILLVLFVAMAAAIVRAVGSALALARAEFQVAPEVVRPGEGMRVWARAAARGGKPIVARASLVCSMLDHREKRLYANTHTLTPVFGKPDELVAFVNVPAYALRSGAVGDELSNLFSEDAHRLLVFWSVDFEIALASAPDVAIARSSIPIEVPEGRALKADRAFVEGMIVETCRAMHSDLVLNWLVRLAASDGVVHPAERALLHQVLREAHGIADPAAADARIAVEQKRDLSVDAATIRQHLPPDTLVAFYRFLYAMAWRDGQIDGREHNFLVHVLEKFGLDARDVSAVEREVMHGLGRSALG